MTDHSHRTISAASCDPNGMLMPADMFAGLGASAKTALSAPPAERAFSPLQHNLRSALVFLLVDLVATQGTVALSCLIWSVLFGAQSAATGTDLWRLIAGPMLIMPVGFWAFGIYEPGAVGPIERFRRRLHAAVVLFALIIAGNLLVAPDQRWPRGIVLLLLPLTLVAVQVAASFALSLMTRIGWWGVPTLVVGAGAAAERMINVLQAQKHLGMKPVAVLHSGGPPFDAICGVPVFGFAEGAAKWRRRCGIAIVNVADLGGVEVSELVERLPVAHVIIVPDLVGLQSLWVDARDLGGLVGLEYKQNLLLRRNEVLKRLLDLAIAVPVALFNAPIILLFAGLIKLISPGPAFFVQLRPGRSGEMIKVKKLRSMHTDAADRLDEHLAADPAARAEWERFCKLRNDPRIIPVIGEFIRKFSIDELPQLWNIISGDMSLVGPRPFPQYHLDRFPPAFQQLRQRAKPGLTGLWQVSARSNAEIAEQQSIDTFYIRNWSLSMDLYIIFQTFEAVFFANGAR